MIKRQDKIQKQLKPKVHITNVPASDDFTKGEFSIPGGVFISKNHTWVNMNQEGIAKVGIDDFAKKLVGKVHFNRVTKSWNERKSRTTVVYN